MNPEWQKLYRFSGLLEACKGGCAWVLRRALTDPKPSTRPAGWPSSDHSTRLSLPLLRVPVDLMICFVGDTLQGREEERGGDDGEKAMHLHSITSSALACNEGAKVNPNSMTVLRLMVKLPQAGTNLSAAPFMQ
jgi:hypothetical protein